MSPLQDFKTEIKVFLIVLVAATILAIGAILLLKASQPAPTLAPSPPQPPQTLDTRGWQTYRSDEFGFEVKYPNEVFGGFPIKATPSEFNGVNIPFSSVNFSYIKFSSDFGETVADLSIISAEGEIPPTWRGKIEPAVYLGDKVIAGKQAIGRMAKFRGEETTVYSFIEGGNYYEVRITISDQDEEKDLHQETFGQILSTFRFVE